MPRASKYLELNKDLVDQVGCPDCNHGVDIGQELNWKGVCERCGYTSPYYYPPSVRRRIKHYLKLLLGSAGGGPDG